MYAALEKKWRMYFISVALALTVKEDVALILVPLGLWVALRQHRRIGVLTMLISFGMH